MRLQKGIVVGNKRIIRTNAESMVHTTIEAFTKTKVARVNEYLHLGEATLYPLNRVIGGSVIHYEKFQHLQKNELDEIVRLHDDMTLHIGQDNGWDKKGYKHYLDWFYKEWARGGKPTTSEGQMFRRLKKSGFVDAQKG